jgi:hypothetical protein
MIVIGLCVLLGIEEYYLVKVAKASNKMCKLFRKYQNKYFDALDEIHSLKIEIEKLKEKK